MNGINANIFISWMFYHLIGLIHINLPYCVAVAKYVWKLRYLFYKHVKSSQSIRGIFTWQGIFQGENGLSVKTYFHIFFYLLVCISMWAVWTLFIQGFKSNTEIPPVQWSLMNFVCGTESLKKSF